MDYSDLEGLADQGQPDEWKNLPGLPADRRNPLVGTGWSSGNLFWFRPTRKPGSPTKKVGRPTSELGRPTKSVGTIY